MADTMSREITIDVEEAKVSAVSWSAILAGGVTSAALTLVLLAFGTGMGFSVVSPWPNTGVSATTFSIGAGLYLIVVAMMASSVGGYIAGRLRTKWVGVQTNEVYFRDTAHGFLAWCFATVLGAAVLASAAASLIGGTASGLSQAVGGAASQSSGLSDRALDQLLRADPAIARNAEDAAASRSELARLIGPTLTGKSELAPADRGYLARVVAARTGLGQAEAEARVSEVIVQARAAADAARKSAAHLALWLTASLLIGALSASLAATEGGGLRQGTWRY